MPCVRIPNGILTFSGHYYPGDQPPKGGYMDWHEWAEVQHKAGLRQARCGECGLFKYPQELSSRVIVSELETKKGQKVRLESRACNACEAKRSKVEANYP